MPAIPDDGGMAFSRPVLRLRDWARLQVLRKSTIRRSVGGVDTLFRRQTAAERRHFIVNFQLEAPLIHDLLNDLRAVDVFWDVGANVGLYSCFAAHIADVVTIEPQPVNFDRLNENLALNGVSADTLQTALSDGDGTIPFEIDERGEIAGAGRGAITTVEQPDGMTVDQRRGRTLVENGVSEPTVVKIDVEGAEGRVIDGMDTLPRRSTCRLIYCEVHLGRGSSVRNIERKLADLGFESSAFERSPDEIILKSVKRDAR